MWFEEINALLVPTLDGLAISILHVGSTSIRNLAAKPKIDIYVVIHSIDFARVSDALGIIGYEHIGDLDVPTREVFRLQDEEMKKMLPSHNLYVCDKDSPELRRVVAFRNYLIEHSDTADEYAKLKRKNAELYPDDVNAYTEAKGEFVRTITDKAIEMGYGDLEY